MDGKIRSDLNQMVDNNAMDASQDRDINFDVSNGMVTVKGDVRTAAEKMRVSEMIKAAPGVKDMANALEIKPKD